MIFTTFQGGSIVGKPATSLVGFESIDGSDLNFTPPIPGLIGLAIVQPGEQRALLVITPDDGRGIDYSKPHTDPVPHMA